MFRKHTELGDPFLQNPISQETNASQPAHFDIEESLVAAMWRTQCGTVVTKLLVEVFHALSGVWLQILT